MIVITYTSGYQSEVPTLQDALVAIREQYPEAVFYADDGVEVVLETEDVVADLAREGARVLAWENEAQSDNDDGQRAVASLRLA
jgi:hypothetical protein